MKKVLIPIQTIRQIYKINKLLKQILIFPKAAEPGPATCSPCETGMRPDTGAPLLDDII